MRNALHAPRTARMPPPHAARPLIALVFEGLSEDPKQLPAALLFDEAGARLHDDLRLQPEHYLARAEDALLQRHAHDLAALIGSRPALVDYGAGDGRQARLLLPALQDVVAYVPVDIEAAQLERAVAAMRRNRTTLPVFPLCQDLRHQLALPAVVGRAARRIALVGSTTFDGFRPLEAVAVLSSIRESMGPQGGLVIGIDLNEDREAMVRAYDDRAGCAAAFNRNLLDRLNRELDATFEPGNYRHSAAWNEEHRRLELSLVSPRMQVPSVAGISVALAAGEAIVTLHSYKYTLESFASLARVAGWAIRATWTDAESTCALLYLESDE